MMSRDQRVARYCVRLQLHFRVRPMTELWIKVLLVTVTVYSVSVSCTSELTTDWNYYLCFFLF